MTEGIWGVEVNEIKVHTYSGSDPERWIRWRARFEPMGRITILGITIPGDIVHVACTSREDAHELMASWADQRLIHKSAMKVRRITPTDLHDPDDWGPLVKVVQAVQEIADA